ncbi:MAG: response regulator [Rhodospirillaceae bacterium]
MKTLSGLNVLLVEDEFLIALDAEEMLRDLGAASVTIASNFEDAQKHIAATKFDLAILDVNLNGQKSFPLADQLLARGTPVVFGTGYNLLTRQMDGYEARICVTKPYNATSLRKGLMAALHKSPDAPAASAS